MDYTTQADPAILNDKLACYFTLAARANISNMPNLQVVQSNCHVELTKTIFVKCSIKLLFVSCRLITKSRSIHNYCITTELLINVNFITDYI